MLLLHETMIFLIPALVRN